MTIRDEAIEKLTARLDEIELEDEYDLTHFMELSSRLKALGESKYFDMLQEICQREQFRGKLDKILIDRARRGLFDLWERQPEEYVFYPIVEAQDFRCFREFTKDSGLYGGRAAAYLDMWIEDTDLTDLNDEAAELLDSWRETYPLPEEMFLPVIVSPRTSGDFCAAFHHSRD